MTTREVLIAARAMIAKGWTQGQSFRDASGVPTSARLACSVCALGAIDVVALNAAPDDGWSKIFVPARDALREVIRGSIVDWNDAPERTQADVLDAFDRAIANCEAP